MDRTIVIVGGGIAGMQCALSLKRAGERPIIVESDKELGGKLRNWFVLFPTFTPAEEVLGDLRRSVAMADIEVRTSCQAVAVEPDSVTLSTGERIDCDAVCVCTGFTLFDARLKEEYGYGIYDNVYTSADLERMFLEKRVCTADGGRPRRIAILHCVGSRDEKVCQRHCSKVCCITGVKQAIELKRLFPEADIMNFYMDIRMFGAGYEELYREAQERYNIHFVRGRISEASPMMGGKVQIKAEDTLTGHPMRMSVDMLVLLVGMRANDDNAAMAKASDLQLAPNGFMQVRDMFSGSVCSPKRGIFYAGAVTSPKTIGESMNEGSAAAEAILTYLAKR